MHKHVYIRYSTNIMSNMNYCFDASFLIDVVDISVFTVSP